MQDAGARLACMTMFCVCLTGCHGAANQQRAPEIRTDNADVYLPRPARFTPFTAREEPVSWFKIGEDDLVVGTQRYVVRLHKGTPVWTTRIPSPFKEHYQTRVRVCRSPDGVVLVVHWTLSTEESYGEERRFVLCAIEEDTGEILARSMYEVPKGIWEDVLAAIPWRKQCLVLLGFSGSSDAEVEGVLRFWLDGRELKHSVEDTLKVTGCRYVDSHEDASGASIIIAKDLVDGKRRIRVIRSGNLPARAIEVGPDELDLGALDIIDADLLLSSRWVGASPVVTAYDLKKGTVRWELPSPCILGRWRPAVLGDGRIFIVATNDSEELVCMVDYKKAIVENLVTVEEEDSPGISFISQPVVFYKQGKVWFATNDCTSAIDECVHRVYQLSLRDRRTKVVRTVRAVADRDEPIFGGAAIFLLPASDGYWLGSGSGIIAYRSYSSSAPPKKVQLKDVSGSK